MKQVPRFFIQKTDIKRKRFLISDPQIVNHMRSVLRLKKGATIELFDGEGNELIATLGYISKEQAAGVVEGVKPNTQAPKPAVFLAQALPRAGKFDGIVRMNTELGVQGFVLYDTEYSVTKAVSYTEAKVERLKRVTVEAVRQSEAKVIPDFYGPMSFKEALEFKADHKLILHSRSLADSQNINKVKEQIKPGEIVLVFIGPEGGFSPNEIKIAQEANATFIYLDLPILRTETAGVVVDGILLS